eukprot:g5742.t1
MLETVGVSSLEELIRQTVPEHIRRELPANLTEKSCPTRSETEALASLQRLMAENEPRKNFLGMGYHGTLVPSAILRNLLENPAWYTAYTPYQAEISQGRLESLVNFQTLVCELSGMEVANASLLAGISVRSLAGYRLRGCFAAAVRCAGRYITSPGFELWFLNYVKNQPVMLDEGSAAAEALSMVMRVSNLKQKDTFFVSDSTHLQTIRTVQTRAKYMKVKIVVGKVEDFDFASPNLIGALVQYPDTWGGLKDYSSVAADLHSHKGHLVVAADPLNLVLAKTPASMGADVVVGNMQRFGVPMFSGGPAAAYFATHMKYLRKMPGRIIGESIDSEGNKAYRLTLQTREQHIRYDKATSNVCTSQVLLANCSAMYAVYHKKEGLIQIAERVCGLTDLLRNLLPENRVDLETPIFDTVAVCTLPYSAAQVSEVMGKVYKTNVRTLNDAKIGISLDESHSVADVRTLAAQLRKILEVGVGGTPDAAAWFNRTYSVGQEPGVGGGPPGLPLAASTGLFQTAAGSPVPTEQLFSMQLPAAFRRENTDSFLSQKIFNSIHSETELMRYMHRLQSKDLSLCHSMITLGSCTMKLNSASSLLPISWDSVANVHPFAPADSVRGYRKMLHQLEQYLCKITGFVACSLQPASGAMGEYAGLLAIRRYHESRGEQGSRRNVCIIPRSAHGTNPASAAMIGMEVKWIDDSSGQLDVDELTALCAEYQDRLAALMITYPSTQGIFEKDIVRICNAVHANGGMVYMDGANMNAHLGLTAPGVIGADVCHLNLHKTFSIPHGGGGPGMGPICCNQKLAPFLPGHFELGPHRQEDAVQNAPYGQAGIAAIPWMFISMLGKEGLKRSAEIAILNANYLKERLSKYYKIAYADNRCSHEFIIDVADLKKSCGVTEEDIAKRLQDYGYHAPTMSWPKAHSLMVEPTESEDLSELDRFVEALASIRQEIGKIESGEYDPEDNPLKNAPHPESKICSAEWPHKYSRETAAFPLPYIKERGKLWPKVARVSNSFGDKNLKLKLDA